MSAADGGRGGLSTRLRRDLGRLESYAAMVGILVGAGIFRVTSDASAQTGPSVILGYLVLAPAILCTAVPYMVFLSTPLGLESGGEYGHVSRTLGGRFVPFLGAWLKLVSYLGASAFLAVVTADYLLELDALTGLSAGLLDADAHRTPIALGVLAFFLVVHAAGVRWFGRLQVAMCAVLGVAIAVLVLPGLPAVEPANYAPFFTGGAGGFARSLPPLFFAYAGFESLAHSAAEVAGSRRTLPRVFLRGLALTTAIFVAMSVVAFGVLPLAELEASRAPMAEAAAVYLPAGAAALVAMGGVLAAATSLNASMFVPARLGLMLVEDGLLPRWLGAVHATRGTPVAGLAATFAVPALLLVTGQLAVALTIAVLALVSLYGLHSWALLVLPRRNPALLAEAETRIPPAVQRAAALVSVVAMGGLVALLVTQDVRAMLARSLAERWSEGAFTSVELLAAWLAVGALVYRAGRSGAGTPSGR